MSRKGKSINNFAFALLGQGFGILISFISRIVFIRVLGKEYLGLNGLFTNILTVLSLAELGIGEAINFSLYKPLAINDTKKCNMLMQYYKKTYYIIGCAVLILGIAITPLVPLLINDLPDIYNLKIIYILFVINTGISYFYSYKRNLIIADQNRYIATIYRYLFYFILNVVQIVWLIVFKNYIGFLILQILNTLLENIFISKKANKMYPFLEQKESIQLDKETKREIVKNTKALMMHKVGGIAVSSTDNIILSKFVNLSEVGLYSNYSMILSALNAVFSQFYNSIIASVGNLFALKDKEKQYEVFEIIDFIGFCIYSLAFVGLAVLLNPFIEIWLGSQFLFDKYIVLVLVINFYITGMRKSSMTFREASGLFYKDRWKSIVEAIINIVASLILVKKIGTIGVFLGTLISSITVCVWVEPLVLYKYGFEKKISLYFKNYFIYMAFTAFLFVQINLVSLLIKGNIYIVFLIKLVLIIIIYLINMLIFFRKDKKYKYLIEMIKSAIIKIKNKFAKTPNL